MPAKRWVRSLQGQEEYVHGGVYVLDQVVRSGGAQSVLGEGAPANGDAHHAGGSGRGDVERRVADVGGLPRGDIPEEPEALEDRSRLGFVLHRVLHGDEAIYALAEPGEAPERHPDGEASFRGDDRYPYAGVAKTREGLLDAGELPYKGVVVLLVV